MVIYVLLLLLSMGCCFNNTFDIIRFPHTRMLTHKIFDKKKKETKYHTKHTTFAHFIALKKKKNKNKQTNQQTKDVLSNIVKHIIARKVLCYGARFLFYLFLLLLSYAYVEYINGLMAYHKM